MTHLLYSCLFWPKLPSVAVRKGLKPRPHKKKKWFWLKVFPKKGRCRRWSSQSLLRHLRLQDPCGFVMAFLGMNRQTLCQMAVELEIQDCVSASNITVTCIVGILLLLISLSTERSVISQCWGQGLSPIYKEPMTKYTNPIYASAKSKI